MSKYSLKDKELVYLNDIEKVYEDNNEREGHIKLQTRQSRTKKDRNGDPLKFKCYAINIGVILENENQRRWINIQAFPETVKVIPSMHSGVKKLEDGTERRFHYENVAVAKNEKYKCYLANDKGIIDKAGKGLNLTGQELKEALERERREYREQNRKQEPNQDPEP